MMKRALAAVLLLTLGLTEQASAQQFLPWTPGAGNSGGGCTNNCTFTGTTNTAGINDTSTLGLVTTGRLQWNGSASAGNGTNGAMLDQEPSFNLTQTVNQTRERYVFDTITNAQVGNTIDEGWFFGRQLTVSGSGSYNSEVNGFHVYLNDDSSGAVVDTAANHENFEASTLYYGTYSNVQNYLAIQVVAASGSVSTLNNFLATLTNDNTTAANITTYEAYAYNGCTCTGGNTPTNYFAFRNHDADAAIATNGPVVIGTLSAPTQGTKTFLAVHGADTSSSSHPFMVISSGANAFYVSDDGSANLESTLTIGVSASGTGTLSFANTTSGLLSIRPPTSGALSDGIMTIPNVASATLRYSFNAPGGGGLSGFGTSPSVSAGTLASGFQITVGATGSPTSAPTVTFPTAAPTTGYTCNVVDQTSVASLVIRSTITSTTEVTWNVYSATTGSATALNTSDVLIASCTSF